eukprot:7516415-Alexandrium_andersonii.AAC.1
METAGVARVRAGSQARFLSLVAQLGFVQTVVRQHPCAGWREGRGGRGLLRGGPPPATVGVGAEQ